MPIQYKKIRFNKSCPDGMEHQMSDGIWMCGRIHTEETTETLQDGGLLVGPSHAEGGIPAIVGGTTPVELEGGEYIINAQTVDAVGQEFLDELNSTETSYHTGGYGAGELPPPSEFQDGGVVYQDGGEVTHRAESTGSVLPTEEEREAGIYAYGGDVSDINYSLEAPPLNEPPENKTYPTYTRSEHGGGRRGGKFQTGGMVSTNPLKQELKRMNPELMVRTEEDKENFSMDMSEHMVTTVSDFLTTMVPHHKGAIMMVKSLVDNQTEIPTEVNKLLTNIVRSQTDEITLMREWKKLQIYLKGGKFQTGGSPTSGPGSIQQSGVKQQRKTKPKPKTKAIIGAPKCPGGYMIAGRCVKDTPSPFKMFGGGGTEPSEGGNECEAGFTLAADGTCIPTTG